MEQFLITPWDTRIGSEPTPLDWDLTVPPEVDAIAEQVIKQYDMTVTSRTLITSKPDKGGAIWRIETDKGPRSLKLLHRNPERSLFSVGLQEYVVRQGARVPALIPAKDGKLFVEMGGKLWIVTDWIDLTPATKVDLIGAQELCYGLGEFHRHTKGYVPPFGAKNSSRLYRWPNYYQKIAKKIGWMREMAKAYTDTVASPSILAVVDQYEQQAVEALNRLNASAYPRMVAMGEPHWGLVHQDYGWSNGQNGPGGLWVIDLDGVSYDLPFRDLRKLITSTMDDMGVWDLTWMRGMIDAYHQANPLDAESYEVLLIDMAVPNEFYKHLKEMFFDPLTFLNTEAEDILQRVVATDQSKAQALAELAADKGKYKASNYEQLAAAVEPQRVPSESSKWDETSWGLQPQKAATSEETSVSREKRTEKVTVKKKKLSKSVADDRIIAADADAKGSLANSGASDNKTSKGQKDAKSSGHEANESNSIAYKGKSAKNAKAEKVAKSVKDEKSAKEAKAATEAKTAKDESKSTARKAKLVTIDPQKAGKSKTTAGSTDQQVNHYSEESTTKTRRTSSQNVIDLAPHLAKQTSVKKKAVRKKTTSARTSTARKKTTTLAQIKQEAQKKRKNASAKLTTYQQRKAKQTKQAAKEGNKSTAKQAANSVRRTTTSGNKTNQAASSSIKRTFTKVAAPSRKMSKQAAYSSSAKKGVKSRGVR
ncbi:CotS family spore coat protein [Brevibacillus choshinensis]|uniref:CotS family spore coat protein n=1 Tax=Brevibacillus choshinensis TaxID=54911 RepID=UPI0031B63276